MRLAELADVVGGRVVGGEAGGAVGGAVGGDVVVSGPATVDSRAVEPGGLFVAVRGDRVDGHDYAASALAAGAAAVLSTRPAAGPTVLVEDPVAALGSLAAAVVSRLAAGPDPCSVLALTGSQGKTGTKDYLAQLLSPTAPTVATAGNFNNELGVPLTVLRATAETRYLVVEMGARGIGHVAQLCRIAQPTVAAVLNVGTAHIGEFGSREAIAVAKGEIVEALPPDGVAVLNADDPLTAAMTTRTRARVVTFGARPDSDLRFSDVALDDLGRPTATLTWEGREVRLSLRQLGRHQMANAAAAAAMALSVGIGLGTAAERLRLAESRSPWRMELHEGRDGTVVLNDAYNANPASMRAALEAAVTIGERRAARTVAVLGEMRELGSESDAGHREVGAYAARIGVDVLLGVGPAAHAILDGASERADTPTTGVYAEDRGAALAWLREHLRPGDVVVLKASRAAELDRVAAVLVEQLAEELDERPDEGLDERPDEERAEVDPC